ncbi:HTH_Tnp_Tc3_2 domain-containing protein [Trichonephila clavipes]|uniref:HTH_Tnp_Tc3_2 domain-containing protein n=1 Tax=Trichonephila clavipes TaxID=2585209 RepID=A0A8X6V431_TRICX|nr:HTH_Tnp_Tc3_2 domain-containing protein [Trichonephila clavipes]
MTVSRQTVYIRLGHIDLYSCSPVRCVPLTATNCRLWLACSRENALWTPQHWTYVMFSDASRFCLQSYSRLNFHVESVIFPVRTLMNDTVSVVQYCLFERKEIILASRTDLHVQI